jgi:excisionase family DNA binding protein
MSSKTPSAKGSGSLPTIEEPITANQVDTALPSDDFLSVKQAAAILNISYGSVLGAIHAGSLAAYRFGPHGGTYRIRRGDLLDYIASARAKQSSRPKARRTASVFKKLDGERLLRAWREQGIVTDDVEEAPG